MSVKPLRVPCVILIVVVFLLMIVACASRSTYDQEVSEANRTSFDRVVEIMNAAFYDASFGGRNWDSLVYLYQERALVAGTNEEFYEHLNDLLFELDVSHLGVVPPDDPELAGEPQLFVEGEIGLELRYIDDRAADSGWPGSEVGIRQGYEIVRFGETSVEMVADDFLTSPTPPFNNSRQERAMIAQNFSRYCFGSPEDSTTITFRNPAGEDQSVILHFKKRGQSNTIIEGLPPIYASVRAHQIDSLTGYIAPDCFHPALLDELHQIVDRYLSLPNLIVDLRGNPGGDFRTRKELAERFVSDTTLFWTCRHRHGVDSNYLQPTRPSYQGKLVILVDELSASSSEEIAGGLQAPGRATVIGQRTVGKVLRMNVERLPNDGIFIYPFGETRTVDGTVLEGHGVIPDIAVELDPSLLLKGQDNQLEAALRFFGVLE